MRVCWARIGGGARANGARRPPAAGLPAPARSHARSSERRQSAAGPSRLLAVVPLTHASKLAASNLGGCETRRELSSCARCGRPTLCSPSFCRTRTRALSPKSNARPSPSERPPKPLTRLASEIGAPAGSFKLADSRRPIADKPQAREPESQGPQIGRMQIRARIL